MVWVSIGHDLILLAVDEVRKGELVHHLILRLELVNGKACHGFRILVKELLVQVQDFFVVGSLSSDFLLELGSVDQVVSILVGLGEGLKLLLVGELHCSSGRVNLTGGHGGNKG